MYRTDNIWTIIIPDCNLEIVRGIISEKHFLGTVFSFAIITRWEGIFVGSDLNDGEWQSVRLAVNESHVFLAANNETTLYPINPVQSINSSDTSFSTTVLGKLILIYLCCCQVHIMNFLQYETCCHV